MDFRQFWAIMGLDAVGFLLFDVVAFYDPLQ